MRMSRRFAIAALLAGLPAMARGQTRDKVVVASKIDAEGGLLGNLILLALERAQVPVEARLQLGPTRIVRSALIAGEIDLYPEYTGNGAFFFNQEADPAWRSPEQAHALVKRLDAEANRLVWLDRAPADNTWAIAVRRDLAQGEHLASMEDFARLAQAGTALRLAASAEFVDSPAALPAFERTYGFQLPRDRIVVLPGGDTSATMRAAAQRMSGVNAAMVYTTDGAIDALQLVVMTDTRRAQLVFEPAPVVRQPVLERFPAIAPALAPVFAQLSLERLRGLNAQVTVEGRAPRAVAQRFLDGR
ncbi:MAG TPA: glycine betaine ABC transporter substrate-binding protein [Roseomonas sp.]|jgi:osmoprotectant transport system substrate-binding protein